MKRFLTKLIWESPLGGLIYSIWHYFDTRRERKAMARLVTRRAQSVEVITKNSMMEGLRRIKRGLKGEFKVQDIASGQIRHIEAMDYAKGDNQQLANALHKAYVYHMTDIKTEADKEKMVQKRLDDYRALRADKAKRDLIRSIRNEKDPEIKIQLESQFKRRYLK